MKLVNQLLLLHIFLTILTIIMTVNTGSMNYCQTPHCQKLNLACDNRGPLANCPRKTKLIEMGKYKSALSHLFNTLRNDVAGGKYRNLPKAARMGRMSWSNELAEFARLDVSRCRLQPRPCMSSPSYYYIGHMSDTTIFNEYEKRRGKFALMKEMINNWISETSGISRADSLTLPSSFDKPIKYRSALLINERNSEYGCAALQYNLTGYVYFYFSCAFATDNLIGRPIYKWGRESGNQCIHRDINYPNLCRSDQDYQNNKYTESAEPYSNPIDEYIVINVTMLESKHYLSIPRNVTSHTSSSKSSSSA